MPKRDEFDDESFLDSLLKRKGNAELPPGLRRIFIVIGVLIVFAILVSVIAASWPNGGSDDAGAVPIIRADTTPMKVKPEEPGGMNVPNKDSTIFETLRGEPEEPKTENLLEDTADTDSVLPQPAPAPVGEVKKEVAAADAAIAPAPAAAAPKAEMKQPAQKLETEEETEDSVEEDVPEKTGTIIDELKTEARGNADAPKAIAPAPVKKVDAPKVVEKPKTVAPAAPVTAGTAYIQLAAVKSTAEASTLWAKQKAKNPELGSLSMRTQTVQTGGATLYRVQAGPVSRDSALSICSAIKARGGSCILAK